MGVVRKESIINSALWAAYGDALGFITELADADTLKWRINQLQVDRTVPWKRRVGGKFGVIVELPAGCYSDDTQLRLATSRSIRGDGKFDVEAFAKVELPVWLSYALGAGRGSKAAASSLAKRDTTWATNFYDIKNLNTRYIDNGGNGAAMRVQPHVWASNDRLNHSSFLPDIIRNSICTHGHPRGIAGAVFHALCLARAIESQTIPGPDDWQDFTGQVRSISKYIRLDDELNLYWLPSWEKSFGSTADVAFDHVAKECEEDLKLIPSIKQYANIVHSIGALTPQHRGSGMKTAILSAVLAWLCKDNPSQAMKESANLLGSDTDSIATMAGAILGAVVSARPEGDIADMTYIEHEASRMYDISNNVRRASFIYPDLLKWNAPTVQSNIVGIANGKLAVSGLGYADKSSIFTNRQIKQDMVWEWLQLSFGQNILVKHRSDLAAIPSTNLPVESANSNAFDKSSEMSQGKLFDNIDKSSNSISRKLTIDEARKRVLNSKFDPKEIGKILLEFSRDENDGARHASRFSEIIVKEYTAQLKKKKWQR